jgi:RNA polymerase sigma-70 factor (ECF subfamily)
MSTPTQPSQPPRSHTRTAHLVERFQAGIDREESFRRLFEAHYRLIRYHFRRQGVSTEEAEDLTQETFLRAYRSLDDFRGEARFATWLFRIAENVQRRVWKRRHRAGLHATVVPLESGLDRDGEPMTPEERLTRREPGPLDALLDRERYEQVLYELRTMPRQMRQCVTLRLFQGLRYREIARVLGISLDAVRVQLDRGRRRLRGALEEPSPSPSPAGIELETCTGEPHER